MDMATEIPSNVKPSMSWIHAAKQLVMDGYILSFERSGIDNQCISLRALKGDDDNILIGFWTIQDCPIRFNWIEKA